MINHYRTLGVDPQADPAVIRSAYLTLIRRYHPDKGGDEADAARTQAVTAAWEVLREPGRRAAYDETRQARFEPEGGVVGPAVLIREPRVRGGAAGRNLFLLLAAGTVGLGWWALGQPQLAPPIKVAASAPQSASAPPLTPVPRPEAQERELAEQEEGADRDLRREPEIEEPMVLPELPGAEPTRRAVRTASAEAAPRRPDRELRTTTLAPASRKVERTASAATAKVGPAEGQVDLAPLERHLQLLTDQSLRFGTEAKRSRLFASRESFLTRLRSCGSDTCKRDAYLRRNAEIGEIMRN